MKKKDLKKKKKKKMPSVMDTILHQRDTVARYLASNTRVGKALSSSEQKEWAQRELKYQEEWVQNGVWRADVKVDMDMIADAWEYTKQESKRAAVRRANAKTVVKKDSEDRMKKREGYVTILLEAYRAAIDMAKQKREGRLADSRPQPVRLDGVPNTSKDRSPGPAPTALDSQEGGGEEERSAASKADTDQSTLYPSLTNDLSAPDDTLAPPPYVTHSNLPDESRRQHTMVSMNVPGMDKSQMIREDPAASHQYPLLFIRNGPVSIEYSGLAHTKMGNNEEDGQRRTKRTSGKWTNEVIEGRSGPAAIIGGEPHAPPMTPRRRHQDEGHGRTARPTLKQGGNIEECWQEEDTRYHNKYRDIDDSHSNREAHTRARYQERDDENRLRDQVMDPDEEGYRMESTRRTSEMEEMDRERNSRDQDREIGARRDIQCTPGGDVVPEQRGNYQSWTQSKTLFRTLCDQGEEIPRDNHEEHLEKRQSQTFRLGARANKLPPAAEICHSMKTRSRTLDPQGLTTSDCPLTMGPASDIRTPIQFNTQRDHTIDRLTSQTRSCGPQPYTTVDIMAPLLTDGAGREAYTPWGHRDMATLANLLPPLTAGASAWIRKFETETIGDVLALGDIRAIIGRTQGIRQSVELEKLTVTTNLVDRTPFDRYRNLFWGCLRELFPANRKKAGISNLRMKPEENVYQYIQRAEDLWVDRNDQTPYNNDLAIQTFQRELIQGLKPAVQKTLKLVASLDYMPWDQWVEQLVHHYYLDQDREEDKGNELEELRIQLVKMKIKEQADLNKKAKNTQEPLTMMPLATQTPTPRPPAPTAPGNPPQAVYQAPVPMASVPNVIPTMVYQASAPLMTSPPGGGSYDHPGAMSPGLTYAQFPQQYQQPQYRNQGYRGRGGRSRGGLRPFRPMQCFYCDQLGHWIKDCPYKPSQSFPPQQQPPQNPHQGPPPPGAPMYPLQQ